MNNQPNHLLQKLACEGSGKEWTPEQVKHMEQSGFFETAVKIEWFGFNRAVGFHRTTIYMRPSDFKALRSLIFTLMFFMVSGTALFVSWLAR